MKTFAWAVGLVSVFAVGGASAGAAANPLVEQVRAANSRFKEVKVAVAEGYSPIPCTSGIDDGTMGGHYVNGEYPKGAFADMNLNVSCDHMRMHGR